MHLQRFKLLHPTFERRGIYEKLHNLTLTLGSKFTQNVAQYPLHHVTYAPAKFEAVTPNDLGGDAFTKKRDGGTHKTYMDRQRTKERQSRRQIAWVINIFQKVDGSTRRVEGNLASSVLSPVNEKAGHILSAFPKMLAGLVTRKKPL